MDNSHVGAAVGAGTGIFKSITVIITTLTVISAPVVGETIILALIGGAFGWLGAEIVKQIKRLYINWKQKRNEKNK